MKGMFLFFSFIVYFANLICFHRLKLEEEHRHRLSSVRKDDPHSELAEQREKERVTAHLRGSDKTQRISPHHLPPMMMPMLHSGPPMLPSPLAPNTRHSPLSGGGFLAPSMGYHAPSVPRSSPSLQRHSPHIHPPTYAANLTLSSRDQRRSPVIQPSGPMINNTGSGGVRTPTPKVKGAGEEVRQAAANAGEGIRDKGEGGVW